jgi:cysteine-S-conjugate beta-lyase
MSSSRLVDLTDDELRARTSIKWSRVPSDVIAADIAELDFAAPEPIRAVLRSAIDASDFGYPDYSTGTPQLLAESFCSWTKNRFGWTPAAERVEICAQMMQALCCCILAYTNAGDCVLTHTPAYGPIRSSIEQLGRVCAAIPAHEVRDVAELRAALGPTTSPVRMIVLCDPHNPTGHVFSSASLGALAEYAAQRDAVLFSDQIYQDLVYDDCRYQAAATVDGLAERTVTFTSAAKAFGIAGLRCAVGHFGSTELHSRFCELPWHLRSGASLLGINATIVAWSQCDQWLDELRSALAGNRDLVTQRLADAQNVRWTRPAATYFGWLDVRDPAAGSDPHGYFLRAARVALQPGAFYGSAFAGHVRLNFGTSRTRLSQLLDRLIGAL